MDLWSWLLVAALAVTVAGLGRHAAVLLVRPNGPDRSQAIASPARGVLYAFTWGMMPWAKESTRRHLWAYLRGIIFHAGIAAGFLMPLLIPWQAFVPPAIGGAVAVLAAVGALAGVVGLAARIAEPRLRRLSTPDDFFSVGLVSAFLVAAASAWALPGARALFYGLAAATLAYIPFGKIRHCFYYFFSRYFFGLAFGRRGVIGWGQSHE